MILNVFSITETFIGLISLILMGWAGILSLSLALRRGGIVATASRSSID